MRNLYLYILTIIVFVPNLFSQTIDFKEKTLRFCGGTHEWPTYYYFKRINEKKKKKKEE